MTLKHKIMNAYVTKRSNICLIDILTCNTPQNSLALLIIHKFTIFSLNTAQFKVNLNYSQFHLSSFKRFRTIEISKISKHNSNLFRALCIIKKNEKYLKRNQKREQAYSCLKKTYGSRGAELRVSENLLCFEDLRVVLLVQLYVVLARSHNNICTVGI